MSINPAPASAAPASEPTAAPPVVDSELMAKTGQAAELGQRKFDASDFAGAIQVWTDAFEALPDTPAYAAARATLLVYVAHAHVKAFGIDQDLQHLRKAGALFASYLDSLDPADLDNREYIQGELDQINAAIRAHEAALSEQERDAAEREAAAREQAAREAELERAAAANSEAAKLERSGRNYTIAGGSVLGAGLVSGGIMVAGLVLGAGVDRRGAEANLDPATPDGNYAELLSEGLTYNRMALASGIVAGVLVATGVTLVAIGAHKRSLARPGGRAQLRPTSNGLVLEF